MSDDPMVKVARDLTAIERMVGQLLTQAVHQGAHPLMPGGAAMVALANVANLEAWENLNEASERYGRIYTMAELEDPDEAWAPFQHINWVTEGWRRENGHEYGQRPTMESEVPYLRAMLEWAWANLSPLEWDEMAKEVEKARVKMENILTDGERAVRGVPCMYDECRGVRIIRKLIPTSREGVKVWDLSDWHCPRCKRSWSERDYETLVQAAATAAKVEVIDGEMWASTDYAAGIVGMPAATVRVWVHRGWLDTVCVRVGRRRGFVRVEQVREIRASSKIRRAG